jgi:hypothetical protein
MNEKIASKFNKVVLGQSNVPMGISDAFKKKANFHGQFTGTAELVDSPMNDDFSDMDQGSVTSKKIEEIAPLTGRSM